MTGCQINNKLLDLNFNYCIMPSKFVCYLSSCDGVYKIRHIEQMKKKVFCVDLTNINFCLVVILKPYFFYFCVLNFKHGSTNLKPISRNGRSLAEGLASTMV
jgi:hypothetical protein